jgi:D-arabinose 1-dehydrogenase-like Zn-dependent alcohol dehydrogenase
MSTAIEGLAVNGKLIVIGASEEPIEIPPLLLLSGRRSVVGWPSGTSADSDDTLSFAMHSKVRSVNEIFPLERAQEAYDLMISGKVRFRAVLQP